MAGGQARQQGSARASTSTPTTGVELDPDWLFDVQVKRIHEYKRQHLNVLHIITLYHRLKQNPGLTIPPRAFIFGGKAAPGYFMAKRIIKLINAVGETVNNDPDVNRFLKVVFVPNFNVQNAHLIYPAADLSEQISTAGKEASGTGNMKFMINGALTIGTLDGANVEIREEVGAENFFLFGLTESTRSSASSATATGPPTTSNGNPELAAVLELIAAGTFSHGDTEVFRPLVDNLLHDDPFLVLADYAAYVDCQERVSAAWQDRGRVVADVDPQHRAQRQVLVGPRHRGVLRRHLERGAGDRHGVTGVRTRRGPRPALTPTSDQARWRIGRRSTRVRRPGGARTCRPSWTTARRGTPPRRPRAARCRGRGRIDTHRLQAGAVSLRHQCGRGRLARRGAPQRAQQRRRATHDPGVDLGEPGQSGDEVGLGEDRAHLGPVEEMDVLLVAADRDVPCPVQERGLVPERRVHRLGGDPGRPGDVRDRRSAVPLVDEQRLRGDDDPPPVVLGLLLPPRRVVAPLDTLSQFGASSLY